MVDDVTLGRYDSRRAYSTYRRYGIWLYILSSSCLFWLFSKLVDALNNVFSYRIVFRLWKDSSSVTVANASSFMNDWTMTATQDKFWIYHFQTSEHFGVKEQCIQTSKRQQSIDTATNSAAFPIAFLVCCAWILRATLKSVFGKIKINFKDNEVIPGRRIESDVLKQSSPTFFPSRMSGEVSEELSLF